MIFSLKALRLSLQRYGLILGCGLSLVLLQLPPLTSPALSQTTRKNQFWCAKLNGVFTTFYFNSAGQRMSLFAWDQWETSRYSHQARCEEVSSRLQRINRSGQLDSRSLLARTRGAYPVVCIGSTCDQLLITFPPMENPNTNRPTSFIETLANALGQVRSRNAPPLIRLPDGLLSYDEQGQAVVDMGLWLDVADGYITPQ